MKNARRIMNVLAGNYIAKSKISTGYKSDKIDHSEGDVWEENDKLWTIKDGIKRTINTMSSLRKLAQSPLVCPKCEIAIRHWQDEKAYMLLGECYTCQLKEEHELIVKGDYEKYIKDKRKDDIESWMKDTEVEFKSYLENIDNRSYVTEAGTIEDWTVNVNKKELSSKFKDRMDGIKKTIEE